MALIIKWAPFLFFIHLKNTNIPFWGVIKERCITILYKLTSPLPGILFPLSHHSVQFLAYQINYSVHAISTDVNTLEAVIKSSTLGSTEISRKENVFYHIFVRCFNN